MSLAVFLQARNNLPLFAFYFMRLVSCGTDKVLVRVLFIFILLLSATKVFGLDFIQAYQAAKQHDKQYRVAQSHFKAQVLSEKIGRARSLPQLNYHYRWMRNEYRSNQQGVRFPDSFEEQLLGCGQSADTFACLVDGLTGVEVYKLRSNYASSESNLTLTQVVFDPEVSAERAIGRAYALKAAAELALAEKQLIIRVFKAYIEVLQSEQQLNRLQEQHAQQLEQYKYLQTRAQLGLIDQEAVIEAGIAVDEQAILYANTKAEYRYATQTLEVLTGQPIVQIAKLNIDAMADLFKQYELDEWQRLAREFNETIKLAEATELIGQAELRKHQLNRLPRVTLAANYQDRKLRGGQAFQPASHSTAYGVDVRLPLYSGGALHHGKKRAAYQLVEAQDHLALQQQQVSNLVASAYHRLKTMSDYIANKKTILAKQKQLLAVNQSSYQAGSKPYEVVLQAQQRAAQTQVELSSVQHQYLLQWFEFKALVGTLGVQDVEQSSQWFTH